MKKLQTALALCFVFCMATLTFAQQIAGVDHGIAPKIFNNTTSSAALTMESPSFKGGDEALSKYMQDNIIYPALARKKGVEGTVILEYYIAINGAIEEIKVIQSIGSGLDQEALKVAQNMPNWNPAMQNSQAKRVKYQLPVKFELD